jgi:hypothetical protein
MSNRSSVGCSVLHHTTAADEIAARGVRPYGATTLKDPVALDNSVEGPKFNDEMLAIVRTNYADR